MPKDCGSSAIVAVTPPQAKTRSVMNKGERAPKTKNKTQRLNIFYPFFLWLCAAKTLALDHDKHEST
jgi:hypothetical protein